MVTAKADAKKEDQNDNERSIKNLNDPNPRIKSDAAWYLGVRRVIEGVEPLIKALKDKNSSVRLNAAWALERIGDKRAVEPLKKILETDPDYSVRTRAAISLGVLGDGRVVPSLKKAALHDPNSNVQYESVRAFSRIDAPEASSALDDIGYGSEGTSEIRAKARNVAKNRTMRLTRKKREEELNQE